MKWATMKERTKPNNAMWGKEEKKIKNNEASRVGDHERTKEISWLCELVKCFYEGGLGNG